MQEWSNWIRYKHNISLLCCIVTWWLIRWMQFSFLCWHISYLNRKLNIFWQGAEVSKCYQIICLKGSYNAIIKIIIFCVWCNRICRHTSMEKKNIIFQILYIIVVPLCPASPSFSTKLLLPTSAVCSDWPTDPVHCDWPNTTSTCRKCNAPFHNRELRLSSYFYQIKPERGTESRDRHSDDARMYLHYTSHG